MGQDHPRVIIWTNYDGPQSPMLHTKFQGNPFSDSREEAFWRVFNIYGRGSHLGRVTWTIWTNICSHISWRLYMKFDFNLSRWEEVWKRWQTTNCRRRDDDNRDYSYYKLTSEPKAQSKETTFILFLNTWVLSVYGAIWFLRRFLDFFFFFLFTMAAILVM